MSTPQLPDASVVARAEAERLIANRAQLIDGPIDRFFADNHFVDRETSLAGIEAFYRERMQRVPSIEKYPESPPWVEHVINVDREVQQITGLSDREMAVHRCLNDFMKFRGFIKAEPITEEKCRVVYLPDSDRGELQIKNIDDPPTFYKPEPPLKPQPYQRGKLSVDGVGSGLHLDDEPEDIFPLPGRDMLWHYADDTPGAVAFLTRYCPFWSGCNVVIYDDQKRSVAIEKASVNYIEVFEPGPDGHSHCSGMVTRDPQSPHGRYQRAKRKQYVDRFNLGDDCSDNAFWDTAYRCEQKLAEGVAALGTPASCEKLITLFTTPWPEGLCKTGALVHPDQAYGGYTLITRMTLHDERLAMRWQRDENLEFSTEPEVAPLM